jgi:phosphoribosyl-AMP cyclohydrolase
MADPTADVLAQIRFNDDGLVPAIAQDRDSGAVLMMAWMDRAALQHTLRTGQATYFSRSRQQQWVKGETSGHTQRVQELRVDCDGDTVLLSVDQTGPACHTGTVSCFDAGTRVVLEEDR